MKKLLFIIAVFTCICQPFADVFWQEFEIGDLTVESWGGTDACTGSLIPSLSTLGYNQYFYINISSSNTLGKQLLANLMLAKSTGRKVGILITNTYNGRPVISGVSVH